MIMTACMGFRSIEGIRVVVSPAGTCRRKYVQANCLVMIKEEWGTLQKNLGAEHSNNCEGRLETIIRGAC